MNTMEFLSFSSRVLPEMEAGTRNDQWLWYGADNLYPDLLMRLRSASAIHAGIIQLKIDLISGEGFMNNPDPMQFSSALLYALATDFSIFNAFALKVVWGRTGKVISRIEHCNVAELRKSSANPNFYYQSKSWKKWHETRLERYRPEKVAAFNPKQSSAYPVQILYFHQYSPELQHYPLASYHSAIPDILFEEQLAKFRLSSMQNGMFPTLHIEVEGVPSAEQRNQFYKDLKRKFAGTDKAGDILVTYGNEGNGRTKIHPIQLSGNADLFKAWSADAGQKIISAHRLASPVLAGLPGRGSLGGSANEITIAFEHFFNTAIRPMQILLLSNLNVLAKFMRDDSEAQPLEIANSKPLKLMFSESLLREILSKEELRAEIGFE